MNALQRLGGPTRFWETVVDLLSDAVFLVGPDRRILYWNRAAEALTGYTREEALGEPCLAAVHCEVCEHRCGVFEFGDVRDVPLTLRNREGRKLEVIKNATVVRDGSGEAVFGIEVLRDVTERNVREIAARELHRAVDEQRTLLRSVLDSVDEGIVGVGDDGIVRFVSAFAQTILGVDEARAIGASIDGLAGPEIARMVAHVRATGTATSPVRTVLVDAQRVNVPVSVSVARVRGAPRPIGQAMILQGSTACSTKGPERPGALAEGPDGTTMIVLRDLREEEERMRQRLRLQGYAYGAIVSRSSRMQEVFDLLDRVAPTQVAILIQGESGTGKELVAREVHRRSRRDGGPFHVVNCAAIAPEILESEFFGHERGAFTGAVAQKPGRFEVASGGTIFLDEVGELPIELQAKLLRVLEQQSFERVGGTRPISVDVRVVAATHRDLAAMVREGRFREDLYYRLRVVPVVLPPLRERAGDIELLAEHFLGRIAERERCERKHLGADALRVLTSHRFPGNVRELANAMEYAAVVAKEPTVHVGDLPRELRDVETPRATESAASLVPVRAVDAEVGERERILAALVEARYRHGEAAARLGMHRTTLYRKRLQYGV